MLIVCDSSALIALAVCDKLNLLDELYEEVCLPSKVYEEIHVAEKAESVKIARWAQGKIAAATAENIRKANTLGLDPGETEAIALYWDKSADRLLIDDSLAREVARQNGINITGSSGILLLAKEQGLIPAVKPYMDMIYRSDVYIAKAFYDEVLLLAGE
jgi:predicted nucleic acid-binding protein